MSAPPIGMMISDAEREASSVISPERSGCRLDEAEDEHDESDARAEIDEVARRATGSARRTSCPSSFANA